MTPDSIKEIDDDADVLFGDREPLDGDGSQEDSEPLSIQSIQEIKAETQQWLEKRGSGQLMELHDAFDARLSPTVQNITTYAYNRLLVDLVQIVKEVLTS